MGAVAAKPHTCHVPGCGAPVPRRLLMCKPHWNAVPEHLQRAVYATYRKGQEGMSPWRPSQQYVDAAKAAVASVGQVKPEDKATCSRCGAPTLKQARVQPEIKGDAVHSIPEWESVTVVHADDSTLAGRAYCERPVKEVRP